MINKSWNIFSSEAIKLCFIKCNFLTDLTNDLPPEGTTEEQFLIFVNFNNDLEESGEISDPQFHKSEIEENELDEKSSIKIIPSHIEINNACNVTRCFLETEPNSAFNSFYKLEKQITDVMLSQKNKTQ